MTAVPPESNRRANQAGPRFSAFAFDDDDAVSENLSSPDYVNKTSPGFSQEHYIPGKDSTGVPLARNLQMLEFEMISPGFAEVAQASMASAAQLESSKGKPRGFSAFNLDFLEGSGSNHGTSPAPKTMPPLASTGGGSLPSSSHRNSIRRKTAPAKPLPLNFRAIESPEDVELIHRVSVSLANPAARSKLAWSAFEKFATSTVVLGKASDAKLPVSKVNEALQDLKIPEKHTNIFQSVLRKIMRGSDEDAMSWEQFQELLVKVLRRIRDTYCARLSRDQLVTRNQRLLDDDYMQLAPCGSGNFGQCSWVVHKVTRKIRVAKKINKERVEMPKEEIEQELDTLKFLDHPHIVRLFEWFEQGNSFYLVMEAAHGGDLDKLLRKAKEENRRGLEEKYVLILCQQALGALVYIHSQNVIHRDLKPANMILTEADRTTPHLLLADFGIADIFGSGELSAGPVATRKKGTWAYMAPEIFKDNVSPKSDVWSLGVIVYELLCGQRPFGVDPFSIHIALCSDGCSIDLNLALVSEVGTSETAIAFLETLLTKEHSERPTAAQAEIEMKEWRNLAQPPNPEEELARARKSVRPSLTKSMTGFKERSTFSKMTLLCIASQLDTSMLEDLNQMFEVLDRDHDGQLSVVEFVHGFRQLGVSEDDIEAMVDSLDINCSGHVEYSEFIAGCLGARTELVDTTLFHAFNVFDINHDGMITLDELRTILGSDGAYSGILPDGKRIEDEFAEIDTSKDGKISYSEFRAHLEKDNRITSLAKRIDNMPSMPMTAIEAAAYDEKKAKEAVALDSNVGDGLSQVQKPSNPLADAANTLNPLAVAANSSKPVVADTREIRELTNRTYELICRHRAALNECTSTVDEWISQLSQLYVSQRKTPRRASSLGTSPG